MTKMRPTNHNRGRRFALAFVLVIVGVEFVRCDLGTFSIVEGTSMYPTFKPNDVVQARTLYVEAERGDVVIISDSQGDSVIKRIVGLPGETVTLYRGFVYINHQRLNEPYLLPYTYTFKSGVDDEQGIAWRLADDQYFVLGDNRIASYDSRHYGPVKRGQITRVVNIPPNSAKPGFYELMLTATGRVVPGKYSHRSPGGI